jgi:hypothetical protein
MNRYKRSLSSTPLRVPDVPVASVKQAFPHIPVAVIIAPPAGSVRGRAVRGRSSLHLVVARFGMVQNAGRAQSSGGKDRVDWRERWSTRRSRCAARGSPSSRTAVQDHCGPRRSACSEDELREVGVMAVLQEHSPGSATFSCPSGSATVDEDHALAISTSIAEHGLLNPVTVRQTPNGARTLHAGGRGAPAARAFELLQTRQRSTRWWSRPAPNEAVLLEISREPVSATISR